MEQKLDIAHYMALLPQLCNEYQQAMAHAYRPDIDAAVKACEDMSDRLDAALQILYAARNRCPDAENMGEFACTNRHQCWEQCGELGNSPDHVVVVSEFGPFCTPRRSPREMFFGKEKGPSLWDQIRGFWGVAFGRL